ncbi:MAG: aconitate hydratase AcnA [Acidilobaceae archaeon]|nr:aconitate hydratase AcnA [Acidilobaceae archaeon]
MKLQELFGEIETYAGRARIVDLRKASLIGADISSLPFSIRVLLENVVRRFDGFSVREEDVEAVARWPEFAGKKEVPYYPERVIMQDFTGVSAILDLAVIREAFAKAGRDPAEVNPAVPVDLIIDHSVQVDYFGTRFAFALNIRKEYERNAERYRLFKWAQRAFKNFRVVPPGKGIIHQVNLEYLAKVVWLRERGGALWAYPDSLLGTDSHTPMVNALGVFGWGVGGVEAEAVVLGEPNYILLPEVMGIRLEGEPREGVTATDIALYLTEFIRKRGAVGKFVEFFGPGAKKLSVPDRATIANMAPEYGATMGFFPIDEKTIRYLLLTGRPEEHVAFVEAYAKRVGLWYEAEEPEYSELHVVDLSEVEPSIAGPANPEDRIPLREAKRRLGETLAVLKKQRTKVTVELDGQQALVEDGMVAIASLTSCTNTSNPTLMIAAGLLAKKAVERGLKVKPWVKTSNAPGSRAIIELWERSGLLPYLEALGFHVVGIGCMTCIGNSGPLPQKVEEAIRKGDLYAVAVLSGNRNFAGRIHPLTKGSFLASPPLVIAYALAGRVDIDFESEPLGYDPNGMPVYLRDIWPSSEEIAEVLERSLDPSVFREKYKDIFEGDENWEKLEAPTGLLYEWGEGVMIRRPPFLDDFALEHRPPSDIAGARVLVWAPDRTNTDHISPAGRIAEGSEAAKFLKEASKVDAAKMGLTFGSMRGNHEVMVRGTFDSPGFRNKLVDRLGAWTIYWPTGEIMHMYHASRLYGQSGTPLLILAGKQYGAGSSRDWAARGPYLLGVRAVIAESYERIHRSNLVCMGILPLEFMPGESAEKLGLRGDEEFDILGLEDISPGKVLEVVARRKDGSAVRFKVKARLDTPVEVEYFKHGGILKYVLRKMLSARTSP